MFLQEVDDDPPLGTGLGRRALRLAFPAVQELEQTALQEELAEPLGDRVDELALLLQEGALVGGRPLLAVEDLHFAHGLALNADHGGLAPAGRDDARRLVDDLVDGDTREARLRVLPAERQDLDDAAEDLVQRRLRRVADLVDPVEAGELLRPLLQGLEEVVRRRQAGLPSPARRSTTPLPERPSTSTRSGSSSRTWRTNSVSDAAGRARSQSQSID